MSKKPTVLMILDGYGMTDKVEGNAIAQAQTPVMDKLMAECPFVQGQASGMAVGLPDGQMGNSEVGHTNMGAGRIVYQMLVKISKSIQDGDFFENEALKKAVENCKKNDSALHLMGLLSPGGVHSHMEHLYGLLQLAKKNGIDKVYVHAYLDGRDVPPSSAAEYMEEAVAKMKEIGVGSVATISGRFYAMDRDNAWDREEKAYAALVYGEGVEAEDPVQAIKDSYANDVTDEFMLPTVVNKDGMIHENDSVVFFNFRPDRARQLTRAFVDPDFEGFERRGGYFPLTFVCMAQYDAEMPNVLVAFPPEELKMTFGEYLSKQGKTQLRLAETQKYAHVTFFFNGGEEKQFEGEDRILVNSPKVATFDLKPEMSAYEVCDNLVDSIKSDKYDVIIVNFANPDMVGHTGFIDAAIKAVEAVDECVGRAVKAIDEVDGQMFICADHGNAERLLDEDGEPFTAHTTNPVPFIIYNYDKNYTLREGGCLADIVPTLIEMMGMEQPAEMTGKSLLVRK
ncbi:MAG: 2,3-bisphosphoglycerate-independent phosphoglycerate mutase [Eubacterium sp.]|nr:2,3-bisphosphoglycerate-independent phosphoglycerate mutase [Clostridiales bacterium]MDY3774826.1 2,3-bisphosphoglycerate-independent phosphoglycerate mutase [Eubacterium sp.]